MKKYTYRIDNNNPSERKRHIRGMFDSIVPTYDFLNRLLSMGIDKGWRRRLVRDLSCRDKTVLDLCCGTGDLSRLLSSDGCRVVSLDFSLEMLRTGKRRGWLKDRIVNGDATCLPFRNSCFDGLTIAFGIRNIPDIDRFITETLRVLKPGGRLMILELTRPRGRVASFGYNLYLRCVLPVVGGIVSRKLSAYRYLSGTIATFLDREKLAGLLLKGGYSHVEQVEFTLGVSTMFSCRK